MKIELHYEEGLWGLCSVETFKSFVRTAKTIEQDEGVEVTLHAKIGRGAVHYVNGIMEEMDDGNA